MDTLRPEERSALMASVRNRGSEPEMCVRRAAHALGLRFRLHARHLPGSPDIVFQRHRVALFVHGCFWHRHPGCSRASNPKTNVEFWQKKFSANDARDRQAVFALEHGGWRPIVIWECETKSPTDLKNRLIDIFALGDARTNEGIN